MSDVIPDEVISQLQRLSGDQDGLKTRLAIIRISEPIFSETESDALNHTPSKRGSDASALDNPTPVSLETDLSHYKVGPGHSSAL